MISMLLVTLFFTQAVGRLQPGTGVVTGSIQVIDGGVPGGIRVGAVAVDDELATNLLAVAETDSAGRYRLTNVPAGQYYIVAGRLNALTYFPGGTDRANARIVSVEAAKVSSNVDFSVPAESRRPPEPPGLVAQRETVSFAEIAAVRDPQAKRRRLLKFVQDFPGSNRLPEIYIELSRTHALQSDLQAALRYAERSVDATSKLKSAGTPRGQSQQWMTWVESLDASAKSNLAWVKQMIAWQQKGIHSAILGKR